MNPKEKILGQAGIRIQNASQMLLPGPTAEEWSKVAYSNIGRRPQPIPGGNIPQLIPVAFFSLTAIFYTANMQRFPVDWITGLGGLIVQAQCL